MQEDVTNHQTSGASGSASTTVQSGPGGPSHKKSGSQAAFPFRGPVYPLRPAQCSLLDPMYEARQE